MSWFLISIIAANSFAVVNIFDKYFLLNYSRSFKNVIKIFGSFSFLIFIALGIVSFFPGHLSYSNGLFIAILSGCLEMVSIFFYFKAIRNNLVSAAVPFFALSPIFLIIFSLFFDVLHLVNMVGILLIVFGIFFLYYSRNGSIVFQKEPYIYLMLLAALFSAIASLLLDMSLDRLAIFDTLAWSRLGVAISCLIISFFFKEKNNPKIFLNIKSALLFFSEALYLLALLLVIIALKKGTVAYVIGVVNVQFLFVFIYSYLLAKYFPLILRENFFFKNKQFAIIGIGVIIFGTILINFQN